MKLVRRVCSSRCTVFFLTELRYVSYFFLEKKPLIPFFFFPPTFSPKLSTVSGLLARPPCAGDFDRPLAGDFDRPRISGGDLDRPRPRPKLKTFRFFLFSSRFFMNHVRNMRNDPHKKRTRDSQSIPYMLFQNLFRVRGFKSYFLLTPYGSGQSFGYATMLQALE